MAEAVKQHYITIQEFMVKDLELKGNELIAYALIYGFSQDEESYFKGSLSYVANWLNCSKTTAHSILNKLADDGFLEKKEKNINGVKLCDYMAVVPNKIELKEAKERKESRKEKEKSERRSKKLNTPSKNNNGRLKNCNGYSKNLNEGVQKILTHNNTDILNDIKDENIDDNLEKGENINKVNGQVKTSVSEKKQMHTQKSAKQRYLDKKADEFEMLNSILLICSSNYDEQIGDEIFKSLEYYFERYTQKTGLIHPILKMETLEDIIDKMANYSDTEYYHFENIAQQEGAFIKIIDAFFDGDFGSVTGQRTNWHLPHFMSDGVLDRLTQRLWETEEVY